MNVLESVLSSAGKNALDYFVLETVNFFCPAVNDFLNAYCTFFYLEICFLSETTFWAT